MKRYRYLLLCWVIFVSIVPLSAQLAINEACADNEEVIADEDGEYTDWIEIYNANDTPISLKWYSLSDDPDEPQKWTFPDQVIAPRTWLVVFASDKDKSGTELHTNFKISKDGETILLHHIDGTLVDQLNLPALGEDQSYGHQPDGDGPVTYFSVPSPGASNNNNPSYEFAIPPVFDNETSFYSNTAVIRLSCTEPGCEIRYTLDGSIPDENSLRYAGGINLDTTTAIRAVTIAPGLRASSPVSGHYFIDEQHSLPVIGITTDPDNLWDWEKGIFQLGPDGDTEFPFYGANFWKDTEIPIFFEFFVNENRQVAYPLGARTHGGKGARTKDLKPLRLIAKKKFGTEVMEYPFFKEIPTEKFERLILRNASGDFSRAYMRDAFLHRYFIKEGLNLDAQADQPVVLYLNGAYWGVLHLRERLDERYLQYKHGVDPDNVDILEREDLITEGDFMIFDSMQAFVEQNDLSIDENFKVATSYFDHKNLADYYIVQTVVNNFDWPTNNIKYWRERKEYSRWRYFLFDLDVGMARHGWTTAEANSFESKLGKDSLRMISVLRNLLDNQDYRHYFINRYADLLNSTFKSENLNQEILSSRDELAPEMERHFKRWGGNYDRWKTDYIETLLEYSEARPAFARQYVMDYFGLRNEVLLELAVEPANGGEVTINTLAPEAFPWTGYYFNGVPVQLNAKPAPGFRFSHWEMTTGERISGAALTQNFEDDTTIKAVFTDKEIKNGVGLYPNPAQDFLLINYFQQANEAISFEIYDTQGRKLIDEYPLNFLVPGDTLFYFDIKDLPNGIYFLRMNKGDQQFTERFVKHY